MLNDKEIEELQNKASKMWHDFSLHFNDEEMDWINELVELELLLEKESNK